MTDDLDPRRPLARRSFLLGAGAVGLSTVALGGCSSGTSQTSTGSSTTTLPSGSTTTGAPRTPTTVGADACVLTPELTAGPYYLDEPLLRADITESRPGIPLEVHFTVIDSTSCTPLADAALDIWHCDAGGEYSGFNGNSLAQTNAQGRNDKRFLRGVQLTDDEGVVRFTTIYPGWYEGRAIHIHLKVHVGGEAAETYDGGHVAHIGQVFFDDELSDRVMALTPYDSHDGDRTRNADDSIYGYSKGGSTMTVTPVHADDLTKGMTATITLAVDPAATPPPAPFF